MKHCVVMRYWIVLLLLVGCVPPTEVVAPEELMIDVTSLGFEQPVLEVVEGTYVRFKNHDAYPHTVTNVDGTFNHRLDPGKDVEIQVWESLQYYDATTPGYNFRGEILVVPLVS